MRAVMTLLLFGACTAEEAVNDDVSGEPVCGLKAGDCALDFSLANRDGTLVQRSDYTGEVLVVAGSAMWCPPCRALLVDLSDYLDNEAPAGVSAVTVVVENEDHEPAQPDDVAQLEDALDLSFPGLADSDGDWIEAWGGTRYSYTVIDAAGQVVWHAEGSSGADIDRIVAAVDEALIER